MLNKILYPLLFIIGMMTPAMAQDSKATDQPVIALGDMSLGGPDAAVQVIEYASFTCPHCATFHEDVFKNLKAEYIDTGKVHFIFRSVYFDRPGLWADMVARCGGQIRYFGIADELFKRQRDWARGSNGGEIVDKLRSIGRSAGISDDQLEICLSDGVGAQKIYDTARDYLEVDGIDATPSFIINSEKYSNMSLTDFRVILDRELGE